jgi:hypothetical protein
MSVLEVAAFRNSTLNEPNVDPEVSGALTGYCADTHDDDIDPDHCKMPTQTDTAEQPQGTPVLSNPTRAQRRTAKKEWEQTKAEALREKRRQKRIERNRHKMVPSQVIVAEPYDAANASVSSSGFMGKPFPRNSAKEIIQAWFSGSIYAMLVAFMLLPFSPTE